MAGNTPSESSTIVAEPRRLVSWLGPLFSSIPTLIVVTVLLGVGWWGHHTGWQMPTFAELTGAEAAEADDWCEEHGVPESACVLCRGMIELPDFGWCEEHGVHNCPFENPEVAQLPTPPKITKAMLARAERALRLKPRPTNGDCCKLHPAIVQLPSTEAIAKMGLTFEPVLVGPIEEALKVNAEVEYDATRMARLAPLLPGRVWRVEKELGDRVHKGDVLALIDATGVGRAKGELLRAAAEFRLRRKNVELLTPLSGSAIPTVRLLEEKAALSKAEADLISAAQALQNLGIPVDMEKLQDLEPEVLNKALQFLGLPSEIVATLPAHTRTANLMPVRSSIEGTVVERWAVEGETVDAEKTLFVVADTRKMWVRLAIAAHDAPLVSLGQKVRFSVPGREETAEGVIDWIATSVDEKTRTVAARAVVENESGRLQANQFGTAEIILRSESEAMTVPETAIHSDGECRIVFVQDKNFEKTDAPKIVHVRSVRVGVTQDGRTEIIAGLLPWEMVATSGSGALRAQLLRGNLGAG